MGSIFCWLLCNYDGFRLFNIKFPVQPNMIHYIGITLNPEKDRLLIENIKNGKIDIEKNSPKWI